MSENIKKNNTIAKFNYSEIYTNNEAAQFFNCLSTEAQDELLTVMRKMVADNKAKQVG